jgi:hypothetical protein
MNAIRNKIKTVIRNELCKNFECLKMPMVDEFLQLYPGICRNAPMMTSNFHGRNIAPCVIAPLNTETSVCSCDLGRLEMMFCICDYKKHSTKTNMFWYGDGACNNNKTTSLFGDFYRVLTGCPDRPFSVCGIAHTKSIAIVNRKHVEMRKLFNSKTLDYNIFLSLWQKFYDDKLEFYIAQNLESLFKKLNCAQAFKIWWSGKYFPMF